MTRCQPNVVRSGAARMYLLYPVILLFLSLPVLAQTGAPLIESIEVRNNYEVQEQVVTYPLRLKVGDTYDERILQEDFRKIMDTGFFDRVRLHVHDGATGKRLVFWVQERPVVKSVDYRGFKKALSKQNIEEQLQDEGLELKINSRLDYSLIEKIRSGIKDLLDEKGFENSTVEVDIQTVSPVARAVYFNINEGSKVKIGEIIFTGNTIISQRRLRWKMKKTSRTWMFSFLTQHNIFSRVTYDEDIQNALNLYREKGYAKVRAGEPTIESYNVAREGKDPKNRLRITIPLQEGEQYRINSIAVEGNELFTDDELLSTIDLQPGDIFNQTIVREALEGIDTGYGVRGYIFAWTDPLVTYDDTRLTADLNLRIQEGEKFFLRRLEFEGNSSTRDKVIRREVRMREGDVFNEEAFKNSLLKVNQLGYFTLLEEPNNPEVIPSMEGNEVDVIIKGEETNRNQLEIGGGVSGLEGAFGRLLFSTRNFLGRGATLSAEALIGTRADRYSISYTEPYIFDRPYIFGVELYKRSYLYYDLTQDRTGAGARFGMSLGYFSRVMLRYSYELIDIQFRQGPLLPWEPPSLEQPYPPGNFSFRSLYEEGETLISSVTPSYVYSTVDNPYRPSRGRELNLSLQLAGGPFGGQRSFYKPQLRYSQYFKAFLNTFFAFNTEAVYIKEYNESTIPGFERLFMGGEMSVRGTKIRTVGPLDNSGQFIGGTSSLLFNLEYHIPVKETPVETLLFVDAGNAFDEDNLMNYKDLVYSYGVEVRVYLPIFPYPLRFIYSFLPDPPPRNSSTDFQFSIGSTF
jgi:outer membrane protein insertion porin family